MFSILYILVLREQIFSLGEYPIGLGLTEFTPEIVEKYLCVVDA
jgi:hypothetical protein